MVEPDDVVAPFIRRLRLAVTLTDADEVILRRLIVQVNRFAAGQDLVREHDRPEYVHVILYGLGCRYKTLPDGSRSIMALLVPGDICDVHVHILRRMDHSISVLVPSIVARIPLSAINDLMSHQAISRALWWSTLVDEAVLREWLVNMGQRPAYNRVAHVLCEMMARLDAVGLVADRSFHLPLTQEQLADVTGISPVHVNRILSQLVGDGLIEKFARSIKVPDFGRLSEIAQFNPNYLHLDGASSR